MARLPSLQLLVVSASATLRRFPFVLLSAGVAATGALLAIEDPNASVYVRLIVVGSLGLPLFTAVTLYTERRDWRAPRSLALPLVGIAGLATLFYAWPHWSEQVAWRRYAQLSAGLHLLVAFLPFLGTREANAFWHYNKALFLRFLTAGLFSGVLFAGLAIALLAVDELLGIKVAEETYVRLWVLIAFIFNTWFFLGGVPSDLAALEHLTEYPKELKIFMQYVLVPLVVIYVVILTAYLGKVVVTTQWPSGWIGYLVSSVSVVGILSLLLVHPIAERAENRWIHTYGRGFYIALFPSIVMLALAIGKRIAQYGITENRYFLAVLTAWLAGISVYYTITRSRNIRIIPQTLCLVAFATLLGPWSAYDVSERSQLRRLEAILLRNELLVDGRVHRASGSVPFEDRKEISAILRYLVETHGTSSIAPWFGEALAQVDTIGKGTRPSPARLVEERARLLTSHLGIGYVDRWQARGLRQFSFSASRRARAFPISGYQFAIHWRGVPAESVSVDGRVLWLESEAGMLRIRSGPDTLIVLPLAPLAERLRDRAREGLGSRQVPPEEMKIEAENERIRVAAYFRSISGEETEAGLDVRSSDGELYVALK